MMTTQVDRMIAQDSKGGSTTVMKGIDILNMLGSRNMTATEITKALGMNKSTVHRFLYTLESAGYIEHVGETRQYRLGIKLVELCSLRINDIELKTEAKPHLVELVNAIRQPVHLGVYSEGNAVFIDKVDVMTSIRIYSAIGRTIPVYCSAIGKALLLNMSDEQVREIVNRYGMRPITPYTLATPEALLAQLDEARRKGYTVDNGEHEENVFCLAVPVYDYRNDIIASISTAAYKVSMVDQTQLIQLLWAAARKISYRLGYHGGRTDAPCSQSAPLTHAGGE